MKGFAGKVAYPKAYLKWLASSEQVSDVENQVCWLFIIHFKVLDVYVKVLDLYVRVLDLYVGVLDLCLSWTPSPPLALEFSWPIPYIG